MLNEATILWCMAPEAPHCPTELAEFLSPPAWHSRAACRDEPVSTFFPKRGQTTAPARAICATCPVREECLERIAAIYNEAVARGLKPLRAIQDTEHTSLSNASKLAAKCRAAGLLPPTVPGKAAGWKPEKKEGKR